MVAHPALIYEHVYEISSRDRSYSLWAFFYCILEISFRSILSHFPSKHKSLLANTTIVIILCILGIYSWRQVTNAIQSSISAFFYLCWRALHFILYVAKIHMNNQFTGLKVSTLFYLQPWNLPTLECDEIWEFEISTGVKIEVKPIIPQQICPFAIFSIPTPKIFWKKNTV